MSAISHTQESFEGGMNLVDLGTRVKANEYILGLNLRSRFGSLEPIMAPIDLTGELPTETKSIQGLYAFGEILVCFIGGQAWYLNVAISGGVWTQIEDFQMSSSVDRIWAQGVPASDLVYLRKNAGTAGTASSPDTGIILDPVSSTGTSEVALVCQDGINQPWLIFSNATAREAQTYTDWSLDIREYVPIGKQMCYLNGVLYIVSADGKIIYRSVTGRPLDFVIAVDDTGYKVADATPLSIAVDSNEIKLIAPSNSENGGGLIVITSYTAYLTTPNDKLLYAEPQFNKTFLFNAGTINQFCLTDLLGDSAFIDREGLKSFNAVQQLKFEGNNSVFSLGIAKLFKGIVQDDNACVGSFDNYTFFSVKTIYSPASIIVYDSVKEVFRSVDLLSSKPIKQFATTYSASRQRFFGATNSVVYELYSPDSVTPLSATVFTRELNSRNTDQGQTDGLYDIRPDSTRLIFEEGLIDGEVNIDTYVNNVRPSDPIDALGKTRDIPATSGAIYFPVLIPVMFTTRNSFLSLDIPMKGLEGQKIGYSITWTGGAKLSYFISRADCKKAPTSIQQQSRALS
jgi:hypothetical protein